MATVGPTRSNDSDFRTWGAASRRWRGEGVGWMDMMDQMGTMNDTGAVGGSRVAL
jgi:hypothetical protein